MNTRIWISAALAAAMALTLATPTLRAQSDDHPSNQSLRVAADMGYAPWAIKKPTGGGDGFQYDVGAEIAKRLGRPGVETSLASVVALPELLRAARLRFALDIERLSPDAGEAQRGTPALTPERVQQVFQTNIYGNVGNVATGGTGAQQSIGTMVTQGDFSSLAENLRHLGIADAEIDDLRQAIDGDSKAGKPTLGRRVGEWCGKMLGKAGEGALKVTVDVAATVLPKLISGYLGLPK